MSSRFSEDGVPLKYAGARTGRLAGQLIRMLTENRLSIAVAESCTGGLLGNLLVRVPGASAAFWGGFVTYSMDAKQKMLGIDSRLLEDYGAVSRECARAMAESARRYAGTDAALAVTGLAGPDGDGSDNPVGTVWVAGVFPGGSALEAVHHFTDKRNAVRARAAAAAIGLGLELAELNGGRR
jgi:PncC family amidohydrolase